MNGFPLVSCMTFVPLIAGMVILAQGKRLPTATAVRYGLIASLVTLGLGVLLGLNFDISSGAIQFEERAAWIPTLNLDYTVGVDGLSLLMIWLTTLLIPVSLRAGGQLTRSPNLFVALVLFLETGLLGTFTALNFFHWFLFWELSLIPAFFLVRLWGGPERARAAVHFFVYTFVGSVGLLLAFLALFAASGTFDFRELAELARTGELLGSVGQSIGWPDLPIRWIGMLLFGLAFLAVAVKVPLYPFHTWLPLTYTQAPSVVTLLLTGLMSKMGLYALLRLIVPIFPQQLQLVATPLLLLAVITIVASAFAAYHQTDLKRILAYSSINHLGYCFLAVFAVVSSPAATAAWQAEASAAYNGVLLQLFNHGIIAGLLFYLVAQLESRTDGVRETDRFGGLRSVAPQFVTVMGIALFASLGLPGLNAFIGEFLMFKGALGLVKWAPAIATLGLLLTAGFILRIIQQMFTGPLNEDWAAFPELTKAERWVVIPAIAIMFLAGIFPQLLIRFANQTTLTLVQQLGGTP